MAAAALLALAGCGAEAPPVPPGPPPAGAAEPGMSVTGEASLGVTGRL